MVWFGFGLVWVWSRQFVSQTFGTVSCFLALFGEDWVGKVRKRTGKGEGRRGNGEKWTWDRENWVFWQFQWDWTAILAAFWEFLGPFERQASFFGTEKGSKKGVRPGSERAKKGSKIPKKRGIVWKIVRNVDEIS